jgi:membrane fusion protein, multidrug efflux system
MMSLRRPCPRRRPRNAVRRVLLLVSLLSAAVGGGFAWWHYSAHAVRISSPVRGTAVEAVYATGVVEPVFWAKITPMIRGRIVDQCQCEGRRVKRGDVLARLDDVAQRARLAELEARAGFLQQDAERYRQLLAKRDISLQTYQRATSLYQEVISIIAAERKRLEEYVLKAPMDGEVLRRDFELGEIVDEGDVLFWVGQPKPLWIVTEVDEEDIPRVGAGVPRR